MSAGAFAAQFLSEIWREWRPFSEEKRTKRRIRKKVRRGEPVTIEEMYLVTTETEPKYRTSTKALVGGTIISQIYVQLVQLLPWDGMVAVLTTDEAIAFAAVLAAGIVARFTKTAKNPGVV